MATYVSTWKSNLFEVNYVDKFKDVMENVFGFEVVSDKNKVQLYYNELNSPPFEIDKGAGIPKWNELIDEFEDDYVDLPTVISKFLKEDEKAIVKEVGNEKLRYVVGFAFAVNSDGKCITLNLNEIESRAENEL